MLLVKSKASGFYSPRYNTDLPLFSHCCEGAVEVRDLSKYTRVFMAHGVQVMIQDETFENKE